MLTVALVPGIIGISATYLKGSRVFRNAQGLKIREIARQSANGFEAQLEKEAARALLIAGNVTAKALLRPNAPEATSIALTKYLEQVLRREEALCISLYDRRGAPLLRWNCKEGTMLPLPTGAVFESSATAGTKVLLSRPVKTVEKQGFILPLYAPLYTQGVPEPTGVLAVYIDMENYFNRSHPVELGASGHANVVMADGSVIYDHLTRGGEEKVPLPVMEKIRAGKEKWFVGTDEHGLQSVMAAHPLVLDEGVLFSGAEPYVLYLLITQPAGEAFIEPIRSVLFGAAIPGFIFALLLISLIYLTLQRIVKPIETLKDGVAAFGQGAFDHRIDIETGDEIEDLAHEFNHMAGELQQLYSNLEEKVRERTAELEATNRELDKANKLKSEFLANMSHELRTPLNSIIGFSEVLADRLYGEINERQERYLKNIYKSGKHLLELINSILDLSKIEAGKMTFHQEEFSIPHVINEVYHILKPLSEEKGVSLSVHMEETVELMMGDRLKFKQILYNLLGNAVKFTLKDGSVSIDASIDTSGDKASLLLKVSDRGIGIRKKDLSAIFDSFRQADGSEARDFEGTGLGLTLTKRYVEMHGGTINVTSVFGKGSCFTVALPLSGKKEEV